MIDIHTHILPGIDDGSTSVAETKLMLNSMAASGIMTVVATPHYNTYSTIESFLNNRNDAYNMIKEYIPTSMDIVLGAEVLLSYDLHKDYDFKRLCIEGTNYVLIELPYTRFDDWIYDEIFKISAKHNVLPIMAHIERYMHIIGGDGINKLADMGVVFQSNIDGIKNGHFGTSSGIKLIKKGLIHLIASDCHNITTRKPCLDKGIEYIASKFGGEMATFFMTNAKKILENKELDIHI